MVYKKRTGGSRGRRENLIECEVISDWGAADQFRSHFQNELQRSGLSLTVPANHLNESGRPEPDEYLEMEAENEVPVKGDVIDLDQGYVNVKCPVKPPLRLRWGRNGAV